MEEYPDLLDDMGMYWNYTFTMRNQRRVESSQPSLCQPDGIGHWAEAVVLRRKIKLLQAELEKESGFHSHYEEALSELEKLRLELEKAKKRRDSNQEKLQSLKQELKEARLSNSKRKRSGIISIFRNKR